MSFSYTSSSSQSFTVTHAKHLASKVATDLKRIKRFYGEPSDYWIAQYESELIEYLKSGYLDAVTYGFQKDGKWIEPTLKYTAKDIEGMYSSDDDPGRIKPGANVTGASFTSFLIKNSNYGSASQADKDRFNAGLPFTRGTGSEPGVVGYMSSDKTYSSGGRSLERSTLKSY